MEDADGRAIDLFLSAKYKRPTRRVNYKKYAIIYFIEGDKVIIHRVIPQKMVNYSVHLYLIAVIQLKRITAFSSSMIDDMTSRPVD